MTIPNKDKSLNVYPYLCYCWKCDCNRIDQCLSHDCNCCTKVDEIGCDYHVI